LPLRIVHRDVSPDNILVSWAGDVNLSDFGIAVADGRLEQTTQGMVKGKSRYMAPEQASGGTLDPRTDVFALGCVICALLTGDSPLADDRQMGRLLAGEELELPASLPDGVRPIVARALCYSRFDRYPSSGAMAEAMSGLLTTRFSRDPRLALREWMDPLRRRAAEKAPPPDAAVAGDWVLTTESGELPLFKTLPTVTDHSPRN
jgi:serine/threonine protein kinase